MLLTIISTIVGILGIIFSIYHFYYKEKKEITIKVNSITHEVKENIRIFEQNMDKIRKRATFGYIPFQIAAYEEFKQLSTEEIDSRLGSTALDFLKDGYVNIYHFNSNLNSIKESGHPHTAKNDLYECLKKIKSNFDNFLSQ